MTTKREAGMAAVKGKFASVISGVLLKGFDGKPARPERIPAAGAILVTSIDAGEPEIDLSPLTYNFEAEVSLAVMGPTLGKVEAMLSAMGAAIEGDRTLGGEIEFADFRALALDEETMAGTDGHYEARCALVLEYSTTNPLG